VIPGETWTPPTPVETTTTVLPDGVSADFQIVQIKQNFGYGFFSARDRSIDLAKG
jgi:hypothetical protein